MDLFEHTSHSQPHGPLAHRLRPRNLEEVIGQQKLFKNHGVLLRRLESGQLQNLILWGPPGCGKTSFATAYIGGAKAQSFEENAIDLGAKRIRELGTAGKQRLLEHNEKTIVFVDEIHRLNRGQQDVLLPFIEKGYFYLVGATTENPSYNLNGALMSRCRLMVFEPLQVEDLEQLAERALASSIDKSGTSHPELKAKDLGELFTTEALDHLLHSAHGDGRSLLNALEEVFYHYQTNSELNFPLTIEYLEQLFENSGLRFDKKGDEHYDTISAFIKSIRGSDPQAGIYYLARMLEGGEDPRFIARRMVILASEDIGNADPTALTLATSALQAVELVGMPEARITLAQVTTYLACAPKSNSSYKAIDLALAEVRKSGPLPVPKALRSASTKLMKSIGYGEGYKYSHAGETGWVEQDFLPETLKGQQFFTPSPRGFEKRMQEYLNWMKGKKD